MGMVPTGCVGDGSQSSNEIDGVMIDISPGSIALGNVSQISHGVRNINISKDNNDSTSNNNNSSSSSSSSSSNVPKILDEKIQRARKELVSMTMSVMTGIIENLVTAGGSAAYHRKALSCLEVSTFMKRLLFRTIFLIEIETQLLVLNKKFLQFIYS